MSTKEEDLKHAVWTIRSIIADDAFAASHQSLGQYRTALLTGIAKVMGEILLGDPTQHPALQALQQERDELRAQVEALTKPVEPWGYVQRIPGGGWGLCSKRAYEEAVEDGFDVAKLYAHPTPSPLTRPDVPEEFLQEWAKIETSQNWHTYEPDTLDCNACGASTRNLNEKEFVHEPWCPAEFARKVLAAPQPEVEVPDHVSESQAAVARNLEVYHRVVDRRRAEAVHPDDAAIDCFAGEALKPKMAEGRAKGRSGWETCAPEVLSRMLREHVEKGDPRDVALFCMMLWSMGARIAAAPQPEATIKESSRVEAQPTEAVQPKGGA